MGPKKKKSPRNAFYFYMIDFKEDAESRGYTFPGGLKEVAEAASPSWKEILPSERRRYEAMAKAWKEEQKGDSAMKYTSNGISYDEVDRKIREDEEQRLYMMKYIEREIRSLTTKRALENKFFYLIHVNWYCMTSSQIYLPAEIAISEFSVKTGVNRVYHTFVNPGPPPTGYRLTAQDNINATHKIPLNFELGDSRFSKILRDITNFIKAGESIDNNDLPPVYTMPDSINHNTSISAVISTLRMLCENEAGLGAGQNLPKFNVFVLEKLFYELRNACGNYCNDLNDDQLHKFPTTAIPTMELEKEVFSSTVNSACEYHQQVDREIYCSLSKVKGWAYLICDFCCQDMDIDLIPGRHCPDLVDRKYLQKKSLYDYEKPTSSDRLDQPSPRKPKGESHWGLPKKEVDGDAWVKHSSSETEKTSSASAWNMPSASTSHPGSMSYVVSGAAAPLDYSEENFPSMGKGRGHVGSRNAGANKLSSAMRGMQLNK